MGSGRGAAFCRSDRSDVNRMEENGKARCPMRREAVCMCAMIMCRGTNAAEDWRVLYQSHEVLSGGQVVGFTDGPHPGGPANSVVSRTPGRAIGSPQTALMVVSAGGLSFHHQYRGEPSDPLRPASGGRVLWRSPLDPHGAPVYCALEIPVDEGISRVAVYRGHGPGSLILRAGDRVPGTHADEIATSMEVWQGNAEYDLYTAYGIVAPDGACCFRASMSGPAVTTANDVAFLLNFGGVTRLIAREGGLADGPPGSEQIRGIASYALGAWNRGVFRSFDSTVWSWDGVGFTAVLRDRDPAPGIPGRFEVSIEITGAMPSINAAGDTAIQAYAQSYEPPYSGGHAVWRGRAGALELIWGLDQAAAIFGPGVSTVLYGASSPLITGSGAVIEKFRLEGPGIDASNDMCLLMFDGQHWQVVAREGESVRHGSSVARVGSIVRMGDVASNRFDQVVFVADDTSVAPPVPTLFTWSSSDGLSVLLRPGRVIRAASGETLVVRSFEFKGGSGGQDGRYSGLADDGRLAVSAVFEGSGRGGVIAFDLTPSCTGDWNTDGGVDGADLQAFFGAWEAGEADANLDGGTDGADVEAFMIAWVNGC
jgi:hypothetical protein